MCQLTVSAIGIQAVLTEDIGGDSRPIESGHSSVHGTTNRDGDNRDEQPGLGITDPVIHGKQQRSDQVQNGSRNAAGIEHTPSSQLSVESTEDQVTDVNDVEHHEEVPIMVGRLPQQSVDESTSTCETARVHVPKRCFNTKNVQFFKYSTRNLKY